MRFHHAPIYLQRKFAWVWTNARTALADDKEEPIQALEQFLLDRGRPDDTTETVFVEFPLYERGYTKHVLEAFERDRGHKERVDLSDAQVEHIMPRTLNAAWHAALGEDAERVHSEWLHRPGNLTLSGYNPELWNHGFARKRERYATSNITSTREIGNEIRWGEEEIRRRGDNQAKRAVVRWIGPKEKFIRPGRSPTRTTKRPARALRLRRRFLERIERISCFRIP